MRNLLKATLIVLGSLSIFTLVLCIVRLNQLTLANNELDTKISKLEESISALKVHLDEDGRSLSELRGNFLVLNNSVNEDAKRRARIAKVKSVIRQEIEDSRLTTIIKLEPAQLTEIAASVVDNCDKYEIPVALLLALIRKESAFNLNAVSPRGAQGLTQVMPSTAEDIKAWLGKANYDPFRITHNINFGAYYLARMLHKFSFDKQKALWAYNCGPEGVYRYLSTGPDHHDLYPETIEYEKVISGYEKKFESLGAF